MTPDYDGIVRMYPERNSDYTETAAEFRRWAEVEREHVQILRKQGKSDGGCDLMAVAYDRCADYLDPNGRSESD